ncbi:DNA-binding transcriptional regulator, FadR family [Chitinophaga eiseniae]|uniref:DNA-binding transcriptional regulator, FadR family n=1 Tax=Chitinophaga eiseniae TaxID=634771 RepID=A0A1T4TVQ4_9BACT|nr:FCD domain-containing protein [Chitinophaga eiseniae]SKA44526.1 DNA-binding transcriptional regulator, FadR family [Chitinophaga eiseniae]
MQKELTLAEQIERKILKYISEKGYQLGDALPKENELAEILGVSRVVLREALSRLRILGFIETKRKRGTVLTSPNIFYGFKTILSSGTLDKDSLKDLYEVRLMLEIGMADFLFLHKEERYLNDLQRIIEEENMTADSEQLTKLDIRFHSTLYKMSGNKSLYAFQNLLNTLFATYAPRRKDWKVKQIISHESLLEILKCGTADAFRTAMRLHLNTRFENMGTLFPEKAVKAMEEEEEEA